LEKERLMNTGIIDPLSKDILQGEYELVGERDRETHYYRVQSELATHSSKGVLKSTDVYRELLKVEPGDRSAGEADRFTCKKFSLKRGEATEVSVPSLEGFSYDVNKDLLDANGIDQNGELYSVPEETFEGLVDDSGAKLPFEVGYQVYSAFYYYHSYTDYAEPPPQGKGIQNLKRIGDSVVVEGSFAESPLPGKLAKDSAFWKNGEITLAFNGLSIVDEKPCAVLGLDSGVCHWSMPMTYMPIMNLKTVGVSNYQANIYLDLESKWVRKLDMVLFEITSTTMWGIPVEKSIPVTNLTIKAVTKDEFDQM
jgi:hypothetical protein